MKAKPELGRQLTQITLVENREGQGQLHSLLLFQLSTQSSVIQVSESISSLSHHKVIHPFLWARKPNDFHLAASLGEGLPSFLMARLTFSTVLGLRSWSEGDLSAWNSQLPSPQSSSASPCIR